MIQVTLRKYLLELKETEAKKPILERRQIPVIREFIEVAGCTESNFYKFLRNGQRDINRGFLDASVKLLKARGFNVQIDDIIHFEE
jgi:hypothetical protein